jgi:chromosomal replication initiator protein
LFIVLLPGSSFNYMQDLWKKALSILQNEVNDQIFSAWFSPISQLASADDSITLGVPNKFFETWIRERYFSLINTAVQQAAGKPLSIDFRVDENMALDVSSPQPAPSGPENRSAEQKKDPSGGWLRSVFSGTRQTPESKYKEIGLKANYTFNNFVVGASNRFAHAAALAVCDKLAKVYNPLFLYGGVGLGKTHLMQALAHESLQRYPRAKVLYITSEEFANQLISAIRNRTTQKFRAMYRNVDVLLIDDIQFIAGKESTQEEFFHTFNALHDAHKQIVLCCDRSPKEIPDLEERLVSRFAWGLIADLQLPDFETRIAIIEKKSENEEIKVPKEVSYFLAENIKTNIREMEGALIRVVAYSKLTGKEMSADLAREVLKGMILTCSRNITIDLIQKKVSGFYGVELADMKTKKRSRAIAYPRQIAMYLSRELTDYSLPDIGGFFGGRDHSTVLHACDKINKELRETEQTRTVVEQLTRIIKE